MPSPCRISITLASLFAIIAIGGCSSLPPEMQESLQDMRGSLPKPLRGDVVPLEEQTMPTLTGTWTDKDFLMLSLNLRQSGNQLTIDRQGERQGIKVVEKIRAELTGRAIKARYINNDPDQIRATAGDCSGSVTKDSTTIRLVCSYGGETFPLNFVKSA